MGGSKKWAAGKAGASCFAVATPPRQHFAGSIQILDGSGDAPGVCAESVVLSNHLASGFSFDCDFQAARADYEAVAHLHDA